LHTHHRQSRKDREIFNQSQKKSALSIRAGLEIGLDVLSRAPLRAALERNIPHTSSASIATARTTFGQSGKEFMAIRDEQSEFYQSLAVLAKKTYARRMRIRNQRPTRNNEPAG
jgi:hypothetical protein